MCYSGSCSLLLKGDSCQAGRVVGHPIRPVRDLRQHYRCMSNRSPRIRQQTFAAQLRHLPYPLDQGLCYLVLTYPRTRPFMAFLFVSSLLCYRLPSDIVSRLCPCLSLIVSLSLLRQGDPPMRDLHPLVYYHAGRTQVIPPQGGIHCENMPLPTNGFRTPLCGSGITGLII